MSLPPVEVRDPDDPRLADYRQMTERRLNAEGGRFVAESERVVRRLVASRLTVHSVLLTPPRLATLAEVLTGPYPVFVASQAVLDAIAGFHVHRGCLAIGERPQAAALPPGARAVVVLEDLTDVDNLGALARHAAAFGADALVLSPRCADPFYRKAIRVSLGAVFGLPIVRAESWPGDLEVLRRRRRRGDRRRRRGGRDAARTIHAARALRLAARRRGAGPVRRGARLLRSSGHHPDVTGRRFPERRDRRRDLPVRAARGRRDPASAWPRGRRRRHDRVACVLLA